MTDGWASWEALFTKWYGPNWRDTRLGRPLRDDAGRCLCAFCRMTAEQVEAWKKQHGGTSK